MPDSPASPAAAAAPGHSPWPLRLLVVASVMLPLAIYAVASWISYRQHFEEAEDRLQRTVATMQEHAIKVFETFEISERYLEELFNDAEDADITANRSEARGATDEVTVLS